MQFDFALLQTDFAWSHHIYKNNHFKTEALKNFKIECILLERIDVYNITVKTVL